MNRTLPVVRKEEQHLIIWTQQEGREKEVNKDIEEVCLRSVAQEAERQGNLEVITSGLLVNQ